MIVVPGVTLRHGYSVSASRGAPVAHAAHAADAEAATHEFHRLGFSRMQFFDLDAHTGHGTNEPLIADLVGRFGGAVQVGGGLEDAARLTRALEYGARWAVIRVRGDYDFDRAAEAVSAHPDDIILSVEVARGRVVSPSGSGLPRDPVDLADEVCGLPLAGLLVRCTERDGNPAGPDLHVVEDVVEACAVPVLVEGSVATIAHLRNLEDRGASCVVIGSPFTEGTLKVAAIAAEYGA